MARPHAELFNTEELTALLGLTEGTVAMWRRFGEGPPSVKIGARIYYRRSELQTWDGLPESLFGGEDSGVAGQSPPAVRVDGPREGMLSGGFEPGRGQQEAALNFLQ
jgi:predicted DNA-binding transcriptional regulator AlpA